METKEALAMIITRSSISRLAWWLVVGGPLFGLLGTVVGMARAFGNLAQASGAAKAQALAHNISLCLWTTAAGLMVGLVGGGILLVLRYTGGPDD